MGKRSVEISMTPRQRVILQTTHACKSSAAIGRALSGGIAVGIRPAQRSAGGSVGRRSPTRSSLAASLGARDGIVTDG